MGRTSGPRVVPTARSRGSAQQNRSGALRPRVFLTVLDKTTSPSLQARGCQSRNPVCPWGPQRCGKVPAGLGVANAIWSTRDCSSAGSACGATEYTFAPNIWVDSRPTPIEPTRVERCEQGVHLPPSPILLEGKSTFEAVGSKNQHRSVGERPHQHSSRREVLSKQALRAAWPRCKWRTGNLRQRIARPSQCTQLDTVTPCLR